MNDLHSCLDQIERATEILNLLEWELQQGQLATSQLQRNSMQQHTHVADALSTRLACLLDELSGRFPAQVASEDRTSSVDSKHLDEAKRQLKNAAEGVAKAARNYTALLRRSRRTVNVLMNVIATSSGAYVAPGARGFASRLGN
jgi:hypothetical protein